MSATPIDILTTELKASVTVNARLTPDGADLSPIKAPLNFSVSMAPGTAAADAAAGGASQVVCLTITVHAHEIITLDLTSIEDIFERTGITFKRIKGVMFRNLSVDDDATYGTNCSLLIVGGSPFNTGGTDIQKLMFHDEFSAIDLQNGDFFVWGTQLAVGKVVDATHQFVHVSNGDDAGLAGAVQVTLIGGVV